MTFQRSDSLKEKLKKWNYYCKILGINSYASKNEIKIAYRQLAKKYHPDINKNPHAQEKFIVINEAYLKLINSDIKKIKFYLKMENSTESMNKAIKSMNKAIEKLTESLKQDPAPINKESRRFFI